MSSYEEWCPVCKSPIVMVTRGIPSMGRCMNGHTSDRRDTLRMEPEKVEALPTLSAAMELPEVKALKEALRALLQAICGPTGFAEAVRLNSGLAYPWPALENAELQSRSALAAIKETKT